MKTWEVLKNLGEDGTKRYKRLGDGLEMGCGGQFGMYYQWEAGHAHLSPLDAWEEVSQEVTWQEALEAWANGKDIKSVIYDEEIFYKHEERYLEDQNGDAISSDELTEGKWYIL